MERAGIWARPVLLGRDNSWAATLGTGPLGIYMLATATLLIHALDLATGLRMMLVYGIALEQNPLARLLMHYTGPLGLVEAKLIVVLGAIVLFIRCAQAGRARLARNCLLLAFGLGVLGAASNLVG